MRAARKRMKKEDHLRDLLGQQQAEFEVPPEPLVPPHQPASKLKKMKESGKETKMEVDSVRRPSTPIKQEPGLAVQPSRSFQKSKGNNNSSSNSSSKETHEEKEEEEDVMVVDPRPAIKSEFNQNSSDNKPVPKLERGFDGSTAPEVYGSAAEPIVID
jgi:hypothetical protein